MDARSLSDEELRAHVSDREWYHTEELRPGIETPGWFDTRPTAAALPWPSLTGLRCLDVGTFDGFWAREMLRRGAKEVVAIDVLDPRGWDWPAGSDAATRAAIGGRKRNGDGFVLINELLGVEIERLELSVYDLDPELVGRFDFVYVGSLLLHLRDPVRALHRVRRVCSDAGQVMVVDAIDLTLSIRFPRRAVAGLDANGRPWWWKPNIAAFDRMVRSAGLEPVGKPHRLYLPPGAGQRVSPVRLTRLRSRAAREAAVSRWKGDPHCALLTRPRPDE